jgi:hypothetical protein
MLKSSTSTDGEQRTDDWRQARAGSVTGTGFQHVMAFSKKDGKELKARQDYRMQLLSERITGMPAPEINAAALSWGKENEEAARLAYEMYKAAQGEPVYVESVGFQQHPEIDWLGTSPDGLVGEHGMIEIKCPWNTANHLLTIISASKALAHALLGTNPEDVKIVPVPPEHMPQIQGNLWVLDRQWCDFVSYDPRVPEHLQLYVYRVERDDAYIEKLKAETLKFLDEVESNVGTLLLPEELPAQRPVEKLAA